MRAKASLHSTSSLSEQLYFAIVSGDFNTVVRLIDTPGTDPSILNHSAIQICTFHNDQQILQILWNWYKCNNKFTSQMEIFKVYRMITDLCTKCKSFYKVSDMICDNFKGINRDLVNHTIGHVYSKLELQEAMS